MIGPLVSFGYFFLLGGVILDIIAIATNQWTAFPGGSTSGLWRVCTSGISCAPVNNTAALDGVRAMMILSLLVSGTALIFISLYTVYVCRKKATKGWLVILLTFMAWFAVLLALTGILVYHRNIWIKTKEQVQNIYHGYSFWLGVATILLLFLSGISFLISEIMRHQSQKKKQKRDTNIPAVFYNPKFKTSNKNVHSLNNPFDDLGTDPQRYWKHPFKNDLLYSDTINLQPGIYSHPWSHGNKHNSDYHIPQDVYFCPPVVWVP